MKPMKDAPRCGKTILLKHKTHGWIEAHFDKGYWVDSPMTGQEYYGDAWVCGDDLTQIEVQDTPEGYDEPEALGWLDLPE